MPKHDRTQRRNAEQQQRHARLRLPVRFDRRDFHRLILERIEAMHIADRHLQRNKQREEPEGHFLHGQALLAEPPLP